MVTAPWIKEALSRNLDEIIVAALVDRHTEESEELVLVALDRCLGWWYPSRCQLGPLPKHNLFQISHFTPYFSLHTIANHIFHCTPLQCTPYFSLHTIFFIAHQISPCTPNFSRVKWKIIFHCTLSLHIVDFHCTFSLHIVHFHCTFSLHIAHFHCKLLHWRMKLEGTNAKYWLRRNTSRQQQQIQLNCKPPERWPNRGRRVRRLSWNYVWRKFLSKWLKLGLHA